MKCPNCGGKLKTHINQPWEEPEDIYQYDCFRCGRGWRVLENGDWQQLFASNPNSIYKADDVKRLQGGG